MVKIPLACMVTSLLLLTCHFLFYFAAHMFQYENDLKQVQSKHDEDVRILRQEILMSARTTGTVHPQAVQEPEAEATYTCKISNFTRKLSQAKSNYDVGCLESEPFFSSHGYKMKLSVNLNEAPCGYAGYMGVYLILMRSDRDGALAWPFKKSFTFVLVDQQDNLSQRQNIEETIVPERQKCFKRPRQCENHPWGQPQFVKHSTLRTRQYVRDHAVDIKILVDP